MFGTTARASVRHLGRRVARPDLRARPVETTAPPRPTVVAEAVEEFRGARGLVLAVLYLAAGIVCLRQASLPGTRVALTFAPAGLAVFAVLRYGRWAIPWLFLGQTALALALKLPLPVATALGVGTVLEAAIDGLILRRGLGLSHRLDRIRDVLALACTGALAGHVVGATVGVTSLWAAGFVPESGYSSAWCHWWIANLMGRLVAAPFLLTWSADPTPPPGTARRVEGLLLVAALTLLGELAFGRLTRQVITHPLLVFTMFPALLWAAVRFGPRGAATGVFVVAVVAVEAAASGGGPFDRGSIADRLGVLNTFLAGASLTSLLMAAVIAEQERIERELIRSNGSLAQQIAERERMQARLVQTEKLASLGLLSAGIAHEINNPLAFVANNLVILDRDCRGLLDLLSAYSEARPTVDAEAPELAARIAEISETIDLDYTRDHLAPLVDHTRRGVVRISEIVRNLRGFARLDQTPVDRVDLHQTIATAIDLIRCQFEQRRIGLAFQQGTLPLILCAPGQISQVVLNMLINALQAVEAAHRADGLVEVCTRSGQGEVTIGVADNGCGIPADVIPRVFDPFFTTKPVGQGTGLGLSISHGIITDHNGRIEIESTQGIGTRVRVTLPIDSPIKSP